MFLPYNSEELIMAEVKVKKAKISPLKVLGETLKFVGCPPFAIGEWISNAADKKAAQKEAASNAMDKKKYEEVCKATGQMTAEELKPETEEVKEPEVKEEVKDENEKT